MTPAEKISADTVRADFNDPLAVVHYTRAAHFLGLWKSEQLLIERFFPDKTAALLEAGCGSGRVTLGLWHQGYTNLTAFDFAEELVEQARSLATERSATAIRFHHADATRLGQSNLLGYFPPPNVGHSTVPAAATPAAPASPPAGAPTPGESPNPVCNALRYKPSTQGQNSIPDGRPQSNLLGYFVPPPPFDGALFMFNGLMQIPGRENRRAALHELHAVCRPGAPLLFTTHDRDSSPTEQALWRLEKLRWEKGTQDPRLVDFGDRYFADECGRIFMHLPDRAEILADLAATGWQHTFDAMRRDLARESRAVLDFSDECRFWSAVRV